MRLFHQLPDVLAVSFNVSFTKIDMHIREGK